MAESIEAFSLINNEMYSIRMPFLFLPLLNVVHVLYHVTNFSFIFFYFLANDFLLHFIMGVVITSLGRYKQVLHSNLNLRRSEPTYLHFT